MRVNNCPETNNAMVNQWYMTWVNTALRETSVVCHITNAQNTINCIVN
jgi:hypothetical protein